MAARFPAAVVGPGDLLICQWVSEDAKGLGHAITESVDHLRPWMPWVAYEPMGLDDRKRMIEEWEQAWLAGGDFVAGVRLGPNIAGSCGIHHRIGPGRVELGYWIHPRFTRRGLATTVARRLTETAFGNPDISHVEIHHDKANSLSGRIPHRLGYCLVREESEEALAPGEVGISCVWRIDREHWSPEPSVA